MQLVAYGAQDIYLTGNPQITFFKVVYRRHTNFAVESIEQTFNGQADFNKRVSATIARNGDLIQQMYLEVILPKCTINTVGGGVGDTPTSNVWTYGVGNALIKQAEIEIGGQLIDRQYGDWMNIWSELTIPAGKREGYDTMVGNIINTTFTSGQTGGLLIDSVFTPRLYVPLQFWFNRNPGLALPLIALQYHEVKLNLELRDAKDLINTDEGSITSITIPSLSCKLYVDYVYLDTDERRRFAQVSHEYLIEQVQFTGTESIDASNKNQNNINLNFNHPVKELIWVHTTTAHTTSAMNATGNRWFNYSALDTDASPFNKTTIALSYGDTFSSGLLQLNGHDRFSVRSADYFRKVQNYDHHTRVPRVGIEGSGDHRCQYIYSYSFALSPEEHQPSGTCNFSRIDNAVLQLSYGADSITGTAAIDSRMNLNIYAVNYNVLRIMSGMGGLAYSN